MSSVTVPDLTQARLLVVVQSLSDLQSNLDVLHGKKGSVNNVKAREAECRDVRLSLRLSLDMKSLTQHVCKGVYHFFRPNFIGSCQVLPAAGASHWKK